MIDYQVNIGRQGEILIEDYTRFISRFPQYARRAMASAMKSEGYRLKGVVWRAMADKGPPGHEWPGLNPHTPVLKMGRDRMGRTKYLKNYSTTRKGVKKGQPSRRIYGHKPRTLPGVPPLLRLRGAVRYQYDETNLSVTIGFLGWRSRDLVRKQAQGYSVPVTPKMRKWAFAMGFPLSKGISRFIVPPRPLMEPIFAAEREQIKRNFVTKVLANIERYRAGG